MKSVSALRRAAAPALAAGVLMTAFAVPAAAQEEPASRVARFSGQVSVQGFNGAPNSIMVFLEAGHLRVVDHNGILAGPGCEQIDDTTADCGTVTTSSPSRLAVWLGDNDDSLSVGLRLNTSVDAGPGMDTIATGDGVDTINVRDGERDIVVCDGGTPDTAYGDTVDSLNRDCERRYQVS
ncbi:hypothetical protein [Streptomyces sp. enrichment culture]|uniref:hypothetical protein n=1 Tax=Streptomyces sp. enrichment culture TaxID=1795815 RepID=UPI003F55F596